jgi:hypothetical protein
MSQWINFCFFTKIPKTTKNKVISKIDFMISFDGLSDQKLFFLLLLDIFEMADKWMAPNKTKS